jgi:hypothetical protein
MPVQTLSYHFSARFLEDLLVEMVEEVYQHRPDKKTVEDFVLHLPSFSTPESDEVKKPPPDAKPEVLTEMPDRFPATVTPAFLAYEALPIKAQYRQFLPANQEGLSADERTYFTVSFREYGDVQAYMSQGRLKIKDKSIWREILTKLDIRPGDTFLMKIIKPSEHYEAVKQ